ncbi:D-alanyl-D-alanine carboxypeptidase family protein [Streptomyces sp. NPDC088197]|uniref:D-alanyl-D-alanine carboxypeptidase family protein n=1 Tax=Streptomyces sp. NPDC088197 TaxID=3365840 RepID=UPI00380B72A9
MPTTAARRTAPHRSALAVLAVSAVAALLGGTVLTGAASAAPAAGTKPAPRPPEHMSTVGGDRLGVPGTQVDPGQSAPALPAKLTAKSWIVADAKTGEIYAAHNAHWRLPPASTLKMLFADTVLPKFPKNTVRKVLPSDLQGMGEGSSLVGIKENLTYTVHDLWLGVFLRSGNDAVHVLSAMNGGVARTVADMNARAKELQAADTHVVTPDGYDERGQVSSAYDLTLFARSGLQNADFREYCSTVSAQFPGEWKVDKNKKTGKTTKKRESFGIQNTNRLLSGDYGLSPYPGIAGVKNGNTTNAGATFTGVAQRDGRTLLVTVMTPKAEHDLVYREAASLLDWGFKAAPTVKPVGTLVPPLSQLPPPTATTKAPEGDKGPATASATAGSSHDGLWTALGVAAGSLLVLAVAFIVVRKLRPLPSPAGGGPHPAPRPDPAPRPGADPDPDPGPDPDPDPDRASGPASGPDRRSRRRKG